MAASTTQVISPEDVEIKIVKWKVKKDSAVIKGSVLALYTHHDNSTNNELIKLKSPTIGIVDEILINAGTVSSPGTVLLRLRSQSSGGCTHQTLMKDMCADCGADLRREPGIAGERTEVVSASVAMVHNIPELIVSQEQALEIGREDEQRLLQTKKLVLLVDLDQTLIHTTNDDIPPNLKDVYHFQMWQGPHATWYHTKLRPHTHSFLEEISQLYELHICTFGVRLYAHTVARFIDPDEKFFSHRILSRDECFDPLSKTANLKALFPCGDSLVCIIDDREDVWNYAPNLIHVKPYRFFQGTADINAPPGLAKTENDDIPLSHKVVIHHDNTSTVHDVSKQESSDPNNEEREKISDNISKEEQSNGISPLLIDLNTESRETVLVSSSDNRSLAECLPSVEQGFLNANPVSSVEVSKPSEGSSSEAPAMLVKENATQPENMEVTELDMTSSLQNDIQEMTTESNLGVMQVEGKDKFSDLNVKKQMKISEQISDDLLISSGSDSDIEISSKSNSEQVESPEKDDDKSIREDLNSLNCAAHDIQELPDKVVNSQVAVDTNKVDSTNSNFESAQTEVKVHSRTDAPESKTILISDTERSDAESKNQVGDFNGPIKIVSNVQIDSERPSDRKEEPGPVEKGNSADRDEVEWDDEDDYLMHLGDILHRIHTAYYAMYAESLRNSSNSSMTQNSEAVNGTRSLPDLKSVIPYVRRKTLKGCNIVFSGLVPLSTPPEKSRAYVVAKALGANIQPDIVSSKDAKSKFQATTHLVAAKPGTNKHKTALRTQGVCIVNSNWLWTCAERWEHCDERLFTLGKDTNGNSASPHSGKEPQDTNRLGGHKRKSDERNEENGKDDSEEPSSESSKRQKTNDVTKSFDSDIEVTREAVEETPIEQMSEEDKMSVSSGKPETFAESINPLFSLSDEDIECMDKEVDELMAEEESDSSSETDEERDERFRRAVLGLKEVSESSSDSLSGDYPRGWGLKRKALSHHTSDDDLDKQKWKETEIVETEDTENEFERYQNTVDTFAPDDTQSSSAETIGSVDDEIADAVEKEFLASL